MSQDKDSLMRRIIPILAIMISLSFLSALAFAEEIAMVSPSIKTSGRAAVKQAPKGKVVVRASSVIHSDRILLKDIASIEGFDGKGQKRIERLFLAKAPKPGKERIFSKKYLRQTLKVNRLGGYWSIPDEIRIKRGSALVTRSQVSSLFNEAVLMHTGLPAEQVNVPEISMKADLLIPSGKPELKMSFSPGETFMGRATAKLEILVNGKRYRHYYVTGKVSLYGMAVVAQREIKSGELIDAGDVELTRVVISKAPPSTITDLDDCMGMVVRATIRKGSLLSENQVEAPILVRRGDMINLIVDTGNLRIETRAIAKQDGRRKQVIKVLNIGSKKVVYGQVVSGDEVRIIL